MIRRLLNRLIRTILPEAEPEEETRVRNVVYLFSQQDMQVEDIAEEAGELIQTGQAELAYQRYPVRKVLYVALLLALQKSQDLADDQKQAAVRSIAESRDPVLGKKLLLFLMKHTDTVISAEANRALKASLKSK